MTDRNLTPYFLTFGPIFLVGAFMLWPASEAIGARGTQSLVDAQDTLMPLLVVGTLGTIMVLSGVYLLISEMMENTGGMNKQLLTVAGVLIVVTLMAFITGILAGMVQSLCQLRICSACEASRGVMSSRMSKFRRQRSYSTRNVLGHGSIL